MKNCDSPDFDSHLFIAQLADQLEIIECARQRFAQLTAGFDAPLVAGSARGSGRFMDDNSRDTAATLASKLAQICSRRAKHRGTPAAHDLAANAHHTAMLARKLDGSSDRTWQQYHQDMSGQHREAIHKIARKELPLVTDDP